MSVLIVGLVCYRARNVLSYTRHIMQNYLAFRDSPIIPLRRSPCRRERWNDGKLAFALSFLLLLPLAQKQQPDATIRLATWKANTNGRRGEKQPVQVCREFESKKRILNQMRNRCRPPSKLRTLDKQSTTSKPCSALRSRHALL